MGAKCGSICAGIAKTPSQFRDTLPDDIDEYHPDRLNKKLPKLSFQGSISNVKIINCPENTYFSVKIKIEDIIEIDLPKRKVQPITEIKRQSGQQILFAQNQLKWPSQEKLAFMMDEFQLRSHFLNVYIYDEDKQISSNVRVNLYAIVTGPYRYDFYINLKNHSSRLLFEIDISQKVEAKLQPLQVKIQLQKGYFAQEFNFSLRQLTHGEVVSTSKVSASQKTLPETSSQWSFDRQHSPQVIHRSDSPMIKHRKGKHPVISDDPRKILNWTSSSQNHNSEKQGDKQIQIKSVNQTFKKKLPHLKVHILSNQIIKSSIHFNLWINKTKDISDLPLKNIEKDSIIFGSIHFNLSKFFDQEYKEIDAKYFMTELKGNMPNYKLEMRKFSRKEKLISKEGQILAKCLINFRFTNPKFFKQISYCVKTEDGIINMTTAFQNYSGNSEYLKNPVISDIINHSIKIQSLAKHLSIMEVTIGTDRKDILRKEDEIYDQFQIVNRELVNSCSSSFVLSSPNLQLQLIETQNAFLQILDQLHMFLMEKSWRFKETCWQIAVNIFKRGEFFLENLGFKEFDQKQYIHEELVRKKKIEIALKYKCIIYKFLMMALEEQDQDGILNRIEWKETFKAFGGFRIPIYRDAILNEIYKVEDQSIISYRCPDFEEINSSAPSKSISRLERSENHIDWRQYFYEPLMPIQESIKLDNELVTVLERSKWLKNLKQRSDEFFLFLGNSSRVLGEMAKTLKTVKWKYFPGYTQIVRSFLIEMKKQQLLSYSTTMIRTSIELLVNDQLINILMTIVLEKTDINNHDSLTRGMNLAWSYMNAVTQDGKHMLPQIFNYLYFYKMLKLVFQTDNSFALGKVLILIEAFFKCFNEEFKQNLSMYLMGKVFFKLFFHWSYAIRMIFHVILISKINYHLIKRFDDIKKTNGLKTKKDFLVHHQLEQRYSNIIQLIYNAEMIKKSEQNQQFYDHCFKELHIKMRKKLAIKKQRPEHLKGKQHFDFSQIFHPQSPYLIQNLMKVKFKIEGLEKDSFYYFSKANKEAGKKKVLRMRSYDDPRESEEAVVSHGLSFTFQDAGFEKCLKKFDTQVQNDQEQGSQYIGEGRGRQDLGSTISDQFIFIRTNPQDCKKQQKSQSMLFKPNQQKFLKKKASYTYFGTQDNILQEMTMTQIREILVAMTQFRTIKEKVEKFVLKYERVPEFDFNVELDKDEECQAGLYKWKS